MPSIPGRLTPALTAALLAATLIAVPAPAVAHVTDEPAPPLSSTAVVDGVGFTVDHAWIDPLVLNGSSLPFFSVSFVFPPIPDGVHTVAHGQAPSGFGGVSHCQISPFSPTTGAAGLTCEFLGASTPGTSSTALTVRSEADHEYGATLAVTLCPFTGCSGEFSAAVAPAALELCVGDDLADLGAIAYDFNVPWNASGAELGAGAPAGTGFDPGSVRDGGTFRLTGAVGEPGVVSIPLVVTDEFGGTHEAVASVTVLEPSPGSCGMLAATGTAEQAAAALAALSLGLVLAGTLALRRPQRPQRGLSSRS